LFGKSKRRGACEKKVSQGREALLPRLDAAKAPLARGGPPAVEKALEIREDR